MDVEKSKYHVYDQTFSNYRRSNAGRTALSHIYRWCNEEFGPCGWTWEYEWDAATDISGWNFKFESEEDKVKFILRWV